MTLWPFRRRRPDPDPPLRPVTDLAFDYEARLRAAQKRAQDRLDAALGLDERPRRIP